ncbi:unnamed protein product, partial [Prorocentrum cordatum]
VHEKGCHGSFCEEKICTPEILEDLDLLDGTGGKHLTRAGSLGSLGGGPRAAAKQASKDCGGPGKILVTWLVEAMRHPSLCRWLSGELGWTFNPRDLDQVLQAQQRIEVDDRLWAPPGARSRNLVIHEVVSCIRTHRRAAASRGRSNSAPAPSGSGAAAAGADVGEAAAAAVVVVVAVVRLAEAVAAVVAGSAAVAVVFAVAVAVSWRGAWAAREQRRLAEDAAAEKERETMEDIERALAKSRAAVQRAAEEEGRPYGDCCYAYNAELRGAGDGCRHGAEWCVRRHERIPDDIFKSVKPPDALCVPPAQRRSKSVVLDADMAAWLHSAAVEAMIVDGLQALWFMPMQPDQLPWATACVAATAWLLQSVWPIAPVAPPVEPPAPSHEQACSCDEELRELLQARGDLEWYRLACFALACAGLVLGVASSCLALLAAGCCGAGGGRAAAKPTPPPARRDAPAAAATPAVLAALAASEEPQILLRDDAHATHTWHHLVLLRRLREAVWVACFPDEGIESIDLAGRTLLTLAPGARVGDAQAGDVRMCDATLPERLASLHAQAARLAAVLTGGAAPTGGTIPQTSWRVADTSAVEFGEEVAADVVEGMATGVKRGSVGLALVGKPGRWLAVELVPNSEMGAWLVDKHSGAGRDPRLASSASHDAAAGAQPLGLAMQNFRPVELAQMPSWPHPGPRAVVELLQGIHALGLTTATYHVHWVRESGVHAESAVAWEHRMLLQILGLAVGYDGLDPTNCGSLELAARRIVMIERAVKVNPKSPCFDGLHKMIEHNQDEKGGVATQQFTTYFAQQAEVEARVLKQNRLLREELEAKRKEKDKKKHGKDGDNYARLVQGTSLRERLLGDYAVALSSLSRAQPRRPLLHGLRGSELDFEACSAWQRRALQRASAALDPVLQDLPLESESAALSDILHSDDLYTLTGGAALGTYDISRLRVARGDLQPKEVSSITSATAAEFILDPATHILKSDAELASDVDSGALRGKPYWDPVLKGSRHNMIEFLTALSGSGLLTWRRRVHSRVGCFFVKKKNNMLRLVLDARWTNKLCKRPPLSRLAVPSALARLSTSPEAVAIEGAELKAAGVSVTPAAGGGDTELCGFSVDLTDGFYQFKCETMASYFGLGFVSTAAEIATDFGTTLTEVYDERAGGPSQVDAHERLEACFLGMAMGWSWALYFCNETISDVMRQALEHHLLPTTLVGDRQRPATLHPLAPAMAPYVDNVNMVAMGVQKGREVFSTVLRLLAERGLVLRDHVDGERDFEFLGMVLDGDRRRLRHTARRSWRLWLALGRLLRLGRCSGDALRVVLGHLCHHFGLRPTGLSCLQFAYRFAFDHGGNVRPLSSTVWDELWICRSLVLTVDVDLNRSFSRHLFCSDSSGDGYALHEAPAAPREVAGLARWKERWRFREVLQPGGVSAGGEAPSEPAAGWAGIGSAWADGMLGPAAPDQRPAAADLMCVERQPRVMSFSKTGIPAVPQTVTHPGRWRLVVAGAWSGSSTRLPIHILECRTSLMGLRRAAVCRAAEDSIVVSLGDNMADVLATERGRASDFGLNALCRQSCAWQWAAGVDWRRRHVESARRVSDFDSRRANRGELMPGETFVPSGPQRQRARQRCAAVASLLLRRTEDCQDRSGKFSACGADAVSSGVAGETRPGHAAERQAPAAARPRRRFFLELFAGHGHLSGAVLHTGLEVAAPFEKKNGAHLDLLDPRVISLVLQWIAQGRVWWIHFGTPCAWASRARSTGSSQSAAAVSGRECAEVTVRFLKAIKRALNKHLTYITLENPATSALWEWEPLSQALSSLEAKFVDFDMCRFGTPYRKATRFAFTQPRLEEYIQLRCSCSGPHLILQGKVTIPNDNGFRSVWLTELAGKYPPRLCRAVAHCAQLAAPPAADQAPTPDALVLAATQPDGEAPTPLRRPATALATPARRPAAAAPAQREERAARRASAAASAVAAAAPALTDLTQVEAQSVSEETRRTYAKAYNAFELHAVQHGLQLHRMSTNTLDEAAAQYINDEMYLKGLDVSAPRNLRCAIIFVKALPKGSLPRCQRAIKGFLKDDPPRSEDPCPIEAAAILAFDLLGQPTVTAAAAGLAFLTQYDTFARPSEILNLKKEDVIVPSAANYKQTCIIVAPQTAKGSSTPAKPAKSGEFDDTVVVGLEGLGLPFVPQLLQSLRSQAPKGSKLLAPLTLPRYEKEIKDAAVRCRLTDLNITPHSARHGGPSTAAHRKLLSLAEIKKRGRWLTSKSVARYEKTGKLLRQVAVMGTRDVARGLQLLEGKRGPASSELAARALLVAKNIHRLRRGVPARVAAGQHAPRLREAAEETGEGAQEPRSPWLITRVARLPSTLLAPPEHAAPHELALDARRSVSVRHSVSDARGSLRSGHAELRGLPADRRSVSLPAAAAAQPAKFQKAIPMPPIPSSTIEIDQSDDGANTKCVCYICGRTAAKQGMAEVVFITDRPRQPGDLQQIMATSTVTSASGLDYSTIDPDNDHQAQTSDHGLQFIRDRTIFWKLPESHHIINHTAATGSTANHYELGTIKIVYNSAYPTHETKLTETAADDFEFTAAAQLVEMIIARLGFRLASAAPTNAMDTSYDRYLNHDQHWDISSGDNSECTASSHTAANYSRSYHKHGYETPRCGAGFSTEAIADTTEHGLTPGEVCHGAPLGSEWGVRATGGPETPANAGTDGSANFCGPTSLGVEAALDAPSGH